MSSKIERPEQKTAEKQSGVFRRENPAEKPDRVEPPYSPRQLAFVQAAAKVKLAHGQSLDDLLDFAADLGIAIAEWHPDYFTFGRLGSSSQKPTIQPKIEPETCLCCESTVYWNDRNGATHCARCRKPPQPSFVESIWVVRCQIDDSGERQVWWEKGSEDDAPGGKNGWKWLEKAGKRVRYELGMIEDAESLDVGS